MEEIASSGFEKEAKQLKEIKEPNDAKEAKENTNPVNLVKTMKSEKKIGKYRASGMNYFLSKQSLNNEIPS